MKKKILITTLCVLAILVSLLTGCTENKQQPISTNYSEIISSNGGMAVVYGDYLYFINGFGGLDIDNTYGKVVRGAIARVNLKDGLPDGKAQIIVPKNVYGTDTTYGGLYIVSDYIYYATTSTDLDGKGEPKTGNMVIARTKVDGSLTETVAKFDDHNVVFKVAGSNLVYIRENGIYSINLADKKFPVTTIEETIVDKGYLINEEFIFYVINNGESTTDNIMKVYPLSGGDSKEIITSKLLDSAEKTIYTLSLISIINESSEEVTLFYTKTDNGINTPEVGIYSYTFDKATFSFDKSAEVRFTYNKNDTANLSYTKFYSAGNCLLALDNNRFDVFNKDGSRVKTTTKDNEEINATIDVGSAIFMFKVEESETSVSLWYINSNMIYKTKIFTKNAGVYTFIEANAIKIFSGAYDSTYVTLEKIGNVIYYFNTDVSNNAYYYSIPDEVTPETDTAKGKVLGIITESDIIKAF